MYEVDPKSVSQFTGASDINGTELWEGDIIEILNESNEAFKHLVVQYMNSRACFYVNGATFMSMIELISFHPFRIIGNIFDNPDLMPESYED